MKAKLSNFIALDLGSNKIAGIAAHIDKKGEARILSQVVQHSKGFKSGIITDLKASEESLISVIYSLEKDCDKNIKEVSISLPGASTKSYFVNQKIKIASDQVTKDDIRKLIHKSIANFKVKGQEIIHYFPLEFIIDKDTIIDDPLGMFGHELSVQLHIISVSTSLLLNLTNCFAKCQIKINEILLGIYASGLACLTEDEKNLGSLILDVGARTTSFAIFLSNKIIYTGYVPIGSAHITSDIAQAFSISLAAAEKLKALYGNAIPSLYDKEISINMDDIDPENPYVLNAVITSLHLAEIINPRVEEIFQMVKVEYDRVALDHLIARRLVLTGGGAMLRGIKELTSRIFEKQVRIAKPQIIPGFAEEYNPYIYSSVIGIIKHYSEKMQKNQHLITADNEEEGWFKKALMWIKENI